MPLVKSVKNISTSGTSKVIPVTQEIKALGLDAKESVVAVLATPGSEEEYALDLALAFSNPDVFYVNDRIMCSKDRYPNGQHVENRLSDKSVEDCRQAYLRMLAMQNFIDVIREYTKNKVSGPYAYYNNELHTFVARFNPDEIRFGDGDTANLRFLIAQINILKACLEGDLFFGSPLSSVKVLEKNFDRALKDVEALLQLPPEDRQECCNRLNEAWNEEVNKVVYCDLYFVGLIVPYYVDEYPEYRFPPHFMVVPSPSRRMAKNHLQKYADGFVDPGLHAAVEVFGPYEDETECSDVVSYLRIKWRIEVGTFADDLTASWVREKVVEYNNSIGE